MSIFYPIETGRKSVEKRKDSLYVSGNVQTPESCYYPTIRYIFLKKQENRIFRLKEMLSHIIIAGKRRNYFWRITICLR